MAISAATRTDGTDPTEYKEFLYCMWYWCMLLIFFLFNKDDSAVKCVKKHLQDATTFL